MKLRHIAALVLGWCLIVPPQTQEPNGVIMVPYSQWPEAGQYATFNDCKEAQDRWIKEAAAKSVRLHPELIEPAYRRALVARCVERDTRRPKPSAN
jgi:hypothetical protein